MQYPLISEYLAAIREAKDNLDTLSHLVPVLDKYGEPYRSSGAFAVVFKMKDEQTGKCYALKCFTEEQEGRAEAYRQIAEELEFVDSPYVTSVKYLENKLFVDSSCDDDEFPVLLMDWVEGDTMEAYIAAHHGDSHAMSMLCYRFCKLAAWLRSQPFAHGDIKPDNIMVRPDGTLTLVDYDGMFVPAMKGQKSPTIGTKDFSHPLRTIDDFDETIDDFALASIALSLKAISLDASLLQQYGAPDRLLFSATDYLNLSTSKAFAALQDLLADEEMQTLLSMFLLANAKKDLSMCSFRLFDVQKPKEEEVWSTIVTDEDLENAIEDEFGVKYSKDWKRLLKAPFGLSGEYTVKKGVIVIGDDAFPICKSQSNGRNSKNVDEYSSLDLCKLILPDSLQMIGERAFCGITTLEEINIPCNVEFIGMDNPFAGCKNLTRIEWNSKNYVRKGTMVYDKDCKVLNACLCSQYLDGVSNPKYVIGATETWPLVGFAKLHGRLKAQFVHDDYDRKYYDYTFVNQNGSTIMLTHRDGEDITPEYILAHRDDLMIVKMLSGNYVLESRNILKEPDSIVILPQNVEIIANNAFLDDTKLEVIVLSNNIKHIGMDAFKGCSSLKRIYYPYGEAREKYEKLLPNYKDKLIEEKTNNTITISRYSVPDKCYLNSNGFCRELNFYSGDFEVMYDTHAEGVIGLTGHGEICDCEESVYEGPIYNGKPKGWGKLKLNNGFAFYRNFPKGLGYGLGNNGFEIGFYDGSQLKGWRISYFNKVFKFEYRTKERYKDETEKTLWIREEITSSKVDYQGELIYEANADSVLFGIPCVILWELQDNVLSTPPITPEIGFKFYFVDGCELPAVKIHSSKKYMIFNPDGSSDMFNEDDNGKLKDGELSDFQLPIERYQVDGINVYIKEPKDWSCNNDADIELPFQI